MARSLVLASEGRGLVAFFVRAVIVILLGLVAVVAALAIATALVLTAMIGVTHLVRRWRRAERRAP